MREQIKIGDQYFIFWMTGLSGPHTYTGGDQYNFNVFITGDIAKLTLAQKGFDYIMERAAIDQGHGTFVRQLPNIISIKSIYREIAHAKSQETIDNLTALKDCRDVILQSILGGNYDSLT